VVVDKKFVPVREFIYPVRLRLRSQDMPQLQRLFEFSKFVFL
jgi:hypothetical protein